MEEKKSFVKIKERWTMAELNFYLVLYIFFSFPSFDSLSLFWKTVIYSLSLASTYTI